MITRQAVTHIPLSQYAFANSERSLTIRLRCAAGELKQCILWYGDRVQPDDPIRFTPLKMERNAHELDFDYYEITFDSLYTRMCYYFELNDGNEALYLYADIFSSQLPLERSEFYQYPFIRREEISTVPEWLKHAVVYNIFPDSFASGRRSIQGVPSETAWGNGLTLKSRLGGTVRGITENLDYIAGLGFNCIYLNPIFTAGEYHKYDLLDYFHISPDLGTDEDFRELVDHAHSVGLRVIIDGVFNHCSWRFFAFDDVVHNGESSRYKDWFYDLTFPVVRPPEGTAPGYASFAYEPKMPKLNTSNPEVRNYFMAVCAHWIREYHVDGWRLDVANEVDREFWRTFKHTVRTIDPDSVMIGEIWENAESWLRGDMFDSAMNYDFRKHCRDFFARGAIDAAQFSARITQMLHRYPTGITQGQLNLLDSHDVSRFLSLCGNDFRRLRLAEVFLFTAPGAPCVFYGDELGMTGVSEPDYRSAMPWDIPPEDLRPLFHDLIALRNKNDALALGTFRSVWVEGSLYIYQREWEGNTVTVALNAGPAEATLPLLNTPDSTPILRWMYRHGVLGPFGCAVWSEGNPKQSNPIS